MHFISIIVPCCNEILFIERFLESIIAQSYPKDRLEIIIVDGMSNDGTYQFLTDLEIDNLIILQNPKKYVPHALNLAIRKAKGDLIVRVDCHAFYPKNYLSALSEHAAKYPNVGNVGTSKRTLPFDDSLKCNALALALSTPLGVGDSSYRTTFPNTYQLVDTVPFGCWFKEIFEKVGNFDEALIRNQDDEHNQRILKAGMEIHLIPGSTISYYARGSFSAIAKMTFQYGLFKPLVNIKTKKITTYRQLAPPFLVLYLILSLILLFIEIPIALVMFSVLLIAYISASLIFFLIRKINMNLLIYFILSIFTCHISYGAGYLRGLFFGTGSNNISISRP